MSRDADPATNQLKKDVLNNLIQEGKLDSIKAQLRSQVIKALEQQKKKDFKGASKYLQGSEISNPITKKVVSHPDGLLCAELIREFMTFYKMNLSLQVFEPEMSISSGFPKTRQEVEREVGLPSGNSEQPLLLTLLQAFRGQPPPARQEHSPVQTSPWPHQAKE